MRLSPFNLGDIIGPIYSFILCCMGFNYRDDFIYIYIYIYCVGQIWEILSKAQEQRIWALGEGPQQLIV